MTTPNNENEVELLTRGEDPPPLIKPRKKRNWGWLNLDTWFWEILSTVFSALCFIAILCLLLAYDQRASPRMPQGLTLNTIISVLATASKCSLLFGVGAAIGQLKWIWFQKGSKPLLGLQCLDDASRGPLGCFKVVGQHRGRSLVCLGAVVTILALAFDPFMQQIISYPKWQVAFSTALPHKPLFLTLPTQ